MTLLNLHKLSANDALMLQQIAETGEVSLTDLMYDTGMSEGKLYSLIDRLKHKGLVAVYYDYGSIFVSLSKRGKRAIGEMRPEQFYAV